MAAVWLANYDVCNADFVVKVMLTRYMKKNWDCNCNTCIEEYESKYKLRDLFF